MKNLKVDRGLRVFLWVQSRMWIARGLRYMLGFGKRPVISRVDFQVMMFYVLFAAVRYNAKWWGELQLGRYVVIGV